MSSKMKNPFWRGGGQTSFSNIYGKFQEFSLII